MLNYNDKEAKKLRIQIRKAVTDLRSRTRSTSYPDIDVRETVSDIYEWAKKEGNLYPALRRAYDLDMYVLFNIEDNAEASFMTDDHLDLAEDINAFCVMCRKIVRAGGLHPDQAWKLHDGSFCEVRDSRKKTGNRRSEDLFNRDKAKRESIEAFKVESREKAYEEYKAVVSNVNAAPVEIAEENQEVVDGLLANLNDRIMDGNFSLDPEKGFGGNIILRRRGNGFFIDIKNRPHSKFDIAAVIYLAKPLVYTDRNAFMYGESYFDVVMPVCESFLRDKKVENKADRRHNGNIDAMNSAL